MAECPGGRTNRGTRSQFRLGLPGLGQCKGLYPIHLGDIMDPGQSSQTCISSSKDLISPSKGTRTLTVREYEQTITELKKENFDLKLKLFLHDETLKKMKEKHRFSSEDVESVQVVVQVSSEIDSLRNELNSKEQLLQDAFDQAKNFELHVKELEKKCADLQCELSSLSERPTKEEFLSLDEEKESLIKYNESLEIALREKEEDINNLNQKLEILAEQNNLLNEKIKKKSLAIQSFVYKSYKEKEMLPDELRSIVISGAEAAKNKNKDNVAIALKRIDSALNQMMSASVLSLDECEKENIESPQVKCLKEEILENSSPFLASHNKSSTEISHLQASELYSVYTQTDIAGCNLLNEYEVTKLQKDAKLSSNVEELREDILLLLLAIEEKNKELSDVKESLSIVQEDLKKALNTTNVLDKDFYMNERNELHERLAISFSVNEELMRHLKILEKFLEDLLQNKCDSSLESVSEKSSFFSSVSRCLNESLKLSNVLSDHLSICEGSKLFTECDSFVYKRGCYSNEESFPHLGLSELVSAERHSSSYPGMHLLEEYIPYEQKDDQSKKESDGSQLCWRCWQQLTPPLNQQEIPHLSQNNFVPKHMGYPSSDSDIWSEPDRNVSMQRIGISLQNSPVASKSPRKFRLKEKRMSCRLSSEQDTSSIELQRVSKKRHGSASRRLFPRDSIKSQDFTSEKFYFLLAEKYSKLKSLLDELENVKNGKLCDDVWIKLNKVVSSAGEALQKLHTVKENNKNYPALVCGKCVMLELLGDIKASYEESDFFSECSTEQEILQLFSREICLLKEASKEPFPLFSEGVSKRSHSTQCDTVTENEQMKINELEAVIVELNHNNRELSKNLDEVKRMLSEETKVLESFKTENFKLSNQINDLKEELSGMMEKERELSIKNEELLEELTQANKSNSELINTLGDLEQKRKESGILLDQLTAELQKNKSDLVYMNKKCLECEEQMNEQVCMKKECEKQLNEQMCKREECEKQLNEQINREKECENKLKDLESTSLNEKMFYLNQISDLNAEKSHYMLELKNIQEQKIALEKERININDNLQLKNTEIISLEETIKEIQDAKANMTSNCRELQTQLKNTKEHMGNLLGKFNAYKEESLMKLKEAEAKYCQQLKQVEANSLNEKKKLTDEITFLKNEREDVLQELEYEKECYEKLKSEKLVLNENYIESCKQISTLTLLNEELKNKQLNLLQRNEFFENALLSSNNECDTLNQDLKCMRDTLQNLESKCLMYEKQLVATAGMKDSLVECLLNINNEFYVHRKKLNEMCKAYGNENCELWDGISIDDYVPVIDADNVQKLCENICSETKRMSQSVDILLGLLKSYHLKSVEAKTLEEKNNLKRASTAMVIESHRDEIEHLKSQNVHLQNVIEELQEMNKMKIANTAKELESYRDEMEHLKSQNAHLQLVVGELQEKGKKKRTSISNEMETHRDEMEHLKSQNIHLQNVIDELHKKNKTEKASIAKEIENYRDEMEQLKSQNIHLQHAIEELQEKSKKKRTSITKEMETLKDKMEHLKSQNAQLQQAANEFQEKDKIQRTNIEKERESYKDEMDHLKSQNIHLQKTVNELQEKNKIEQINTAKEVETYKEEMEQLKSQNVHLQHAVDELQEKSKTKRTSIAKELETQKGEIEHLKSQNMHLQNMIDEFQEKKRTSITKEMESRRDEIEQLKSQNVCLQQIIDELQSSISDKEKSIQCSAYEIQSLKENLHEFEKEIGKGKDILQKKDDEITMLQERIFNLQTHVNSIMADGMNIPEKNSSIEKISVKDSISPNSQLLSKPILTASKMCQTNEFENIIQSADESFASTSSLETSKNSCCEKYQKNYHSLQTKLAFCRKHIEILRKEKEDLRESLLQQIQSKTDASGKSDVISTLVELESKLEQKKAFITDLKAELLKTYNSLIDKEKEVDDLKQKLAEHEATSKHGIFEVSDRHSITAPKSVDTNIKTLKNYKWRLIQTIFDIQRRFYEKKGIHLNYFDRFKDHVNNLYSLQLSPILSKSQSMPLLESQVLKQQYEQKDERIKSLVGLELDIQCLENLKIFLNRFFLPYVFNTPETADENVVDFKEKEVPLDNLLQIATKELGKLTPEEVVDFRPKNIKSKTSKPEKIADLKQKKSSSDRLIQTGIEGLKESALIKITADELKQISFDKLLQTQIEELKESKLVKSVGFGESDFSSDKLLPAETEKLRKSKPGTIDILDLSYPEIFNLASQEEMLLEKFHSFDRFVSTISHNLDYIEKFFIAVKQYQWSDNLDLFAEDSTDKAEVKSLLLKILEEIRILHECSGKLFNFNALLKAFDFVAASLVSLSTRQDVSDRESVMSEETIAVSRIESPISFEDVCPVKLPRPQSLQLKEKTFRPLSSRNKGTVIEPDSAKITAIGSSCDSVCQRSHYSSPDLGIESDPNHDSSAPEQKEESINKYQRLILEEQKFVMKPQLKTAFTNTESAGRWSGCKFGETLYAIGTLPHFELLKKEVKESLVAIKSVLSRTGDGLHHIAKYTSPRKTLEYNTLKSIKDTCVHIEVCLKEANNLVSKFWIAPCPTEKEWKLLSDENQSLSEQLSNLKVMIAKQENQFKKAMVKLEHAQQVKTNIEKKISKKLVSTKKVIRQAELKLLENRCQNFPPVPKYPSDQVEQASMVTQM